MSITRIFASLLATVLAAPILADNQGPQRTDIAVLHMEVTEEDRDNICGTASAATWDILTNSAFRRAGLTVEAAFANVNCYLARGTSSAFTGNILHAIIRNNPNKQNNTLAISNYLLREDPSPLKRTVFVGLVLGVGEQPNIFHQLQNSWNYEASARGLIENSARIICLSIDRYNVTELSDIRTTECLAEPFHFPLPE